MSKAEFGGAKSLMDGQDVHTLTLQPRPHGHDIVSKKGIYSLIRIRPFAKDAVTYIPD